MFQVVRDHFETFRAHAAAMRAGDGLPRFVEREFYEFLTCGSLASGFARFRCGRCGVDRLVAFSCKGRAVCQSCGARRMAERASQLVDRVLPRVPIRQWVLTLPYHVRYLLAWDHTFCRALVGVLMRSVLGGLRRAAARRGIALGQGGGIAVVQRFGRALNLDVHVHALVLDGVCADTAAGLAFVPADEVTDVDVTEVLANIVPAAQALLARRGRSRDDDGPDAFLEGEPTLAHLAAAAVRGTTALGHRAGTRTRRCGDASARGGATPPARSHAEQDGNDLEAGVHVRAEQRERLERLCRYVLRPPVADARLRRLEDGDILLALERRWSDGTTHLRFSPVELLERLAVLIPRPRINLVSYHGVLGARASRRSQVVARAGGTEAARPGGMALAPPADEKPCPTPSGRRWADLMRRTYGLDVLSCPRCGGRLRLIALIDERAVIERLLTHLGQPTQVPRATASRAPPGDGAAAWAWRRPGDL